MRLSGCGELGQAGRTQAAQLCLQGRSPTRSPSPLPALSLPPALQFACPGSFQPAACALSTPSAAAATEACDAHSADCSAVSFLSVDSPTPTSPASGRSYVAILKRLPCCSLSPALFVYAPGAVVYLKAGRAELAPPSPPSPPPLLPGSDRRASWSVLMRAQGELRSLPGGGELPLPCALASCAPPAAAPLPTLCCIDSETSLPSRSPPRPGAGAVIVGQHTFLPGAQVSAITVESFEGCIRRCTAHPDCKCARAGRAA